MIIGVLLPRAGETAGKCDGIELQGVPRPIDVRHPSCSWVSTHLPAAPAMLPAAWEHWCSRWMRIHGTLQVIAPFTASFCSYSRLQHQPRPPQAATSPTPCICCSPQLTPPPPPPPRPAPNVPTTRQMILLTYSAVAGDFWDPHQPPAAQGIISSAITRLAVFLGCALQHVGDRRGLGI